MVLGQIGQRLEQARIATGLTLEQVQEITKIRLKYLVALEAEDWQSLPGEVYLKGFLKSYAQAVGLDPAEILELYRPTPPPQPEPIPVATARVRTAAVPHVDRLPSMGSTPIPPRHHPKGRGAGRRRIRERVSVVVMAALLLGLVAFFGYRFLVPPTAMTPPPVSPSGSADPAATTTVPGTEGQSSSGGGNTANLPPTTQLIKVSESLLEVRYRVQTAQPLALKVGIKEASPQGPVGECWIDVQSDDRNIGDTMLRSGRTQEYAATDSLRLRLGNPQVTGLTIMINGIEVPRLQTTEPVDLIFIRQNP